MLVYPRLFRAYGRPILFIGLATAGAAVATFVAAKLRSRGKSRGAGVMQFFVTGTAPVLWAVAMGRMSGVESAAGLAMINAIGLLGGFFGPNILGIAEAQTGNPGAAIILLTVACIIALLAVAALRPLLRRDRVTSNVADSDVAA